MKDTGWTFQGYRVLESENVPTPVGIRYTDSHQERTMTINHIDQLAQWYADAEQITKTNLPRAGDTLILPYNAGGYGVEVEEDGWTPDDVVRGEPTRILSRAPKPKPAWHDAVAVVATVPNEYGEDERGVWIPGSHGMWEDDMGRMFDSADLRDATPLIEAKVTDEAVLRALNEHWGADAKHLTHYSDGGVSEMRAVLAAALGLETT